MPCSLRCLGISLPLLLAPGAFAAEQIGKALAITVTVSGDLTIHGITKPITAKGTVSVDAAGQVKATSEFLVKPEDHGIKIPSVVRSNIAESMKVIVELDYAKM